MDNLEILKKTGNIKAKDLKAISGRESIRYQKKKIIKEIRKNAPNVEKQLEKYLLEIRENLNSIKFFPTE